MTDEQLLREALDALELAEHKADQILRRECNPLRRAQAIQQVTQQTIAKLEERLLQE